MGKQKSWLARLTAAARWYLPPAEAAEVIGDYREILEDDGRSETERERELGSPAQAVRTLVRPREYRLWLGVFLALSACILALGFSPTIIGLPIWRLCFDAYSGYPPIAILPSALGAATALGWSRRRGRKAERLPRAVPVLLAALLAWIGAVLLLCRVCSVDYLGFCRLWGTMKPLVGPREWTYRSFYLAMLALEYGSAAISLAGELGLVRSRTGDRRWAAVYVLALTAVLVSLWPLSMSNWLYLRGSTAEESFRQILPQCMGITAVGLVGTGAALC